MAFQQQRSRPRVQRDSHEDHHHQQALSQTVPHRAPLGAGAHHSDHATSSISAGAASGTDTGAGTGHGAAENTSYASSHTTWHEDDEVLLFGGASASASAADSSSWYAQGNGSVLTPHAPLAAGDDWTLLSAPAPHHRHHHPYQRTLSPAATRSSTSTSTSATSSFELGAREGGDLSVSLFPAHDGNGRFLSLSSDSLVNSTLYDRAESSTQASSDANSSSFVRTRRHRPRPIASDDGSQWSDVADPDSAEYMRRPPTSRSASAAAPTHASSSLSASWALTEAALSTIPDASIGRRIVLRRPEDRVVQEEVEQEDEDPQSAGFTSDSSVEDENLPPRERRRRAASRRAATPTARLIPVAPLQSREDEEEDMLCRTPGAESAGLHLNSRRHLRAVPSTYEEHRTHGRLHSSQRSREAYPSPPPEDRLSASKSSVKRRHRQSGRSGSSQKRSSTSGSIRHASVRHASVASTMPTIAQLLEEKQMAEARREEVQNQIWLGSLVTGKTMGIDAETLEMVAAAEPLTPEATPTPSRVASPRLRNRTPELGDAHGIAALMRHAERELGTEASKIFQMHEAEDESEEEEEEGETDTEQSSSKSPTVAWHRTTEPLVFAPRHATIPNEAVSLIEASRENPSRSLSTSSLPMYLADHSLKASSGRLGPLTSTSPANSEDPVSDPLRLRRRTTSFTNSLNSNSDESPWGGEFDGLEAAIVYWRSLWRRIRGLSA
ncbi:BZ3500_MvSof-1268-A1-R1_Chr10-1g02580 [Microbotryum saponariae]|uniref:BZ3500_MvSof-1268-A1-R1_Chr10-1g02580 protein n=1 Tax=Microbotryum saponariae TaxID=289078 RepID=A0A2X0N2Q6_9BASI|nr:BZ3500_MvSof-1268-A1-R1_Chr10-1g02580 [Microbotryum saponariae]SDA06069.1 BZ3501_MvSof-1269-A2-R1_Chr10-1g02181 [Microbotryum saponariae]